MIANRHPPPHHLYSFVQFHLQPGDLPCREKPGPPNPNRKRGQDSFRRGLVVVSWAPMPRAKRICPAGDVFHVLNRADRKRGQDSFPKGLVVVSWAPCLARNASVRPEMSSTCSIARWPGSRSLKSRRTTTRFGRSCRKPGRRFRCRSSRWWSCRILPGPVGRASADGAAVRRAESGAGPVGGACGAVAVGFGLGAAARGGGRAVLAGHAPRSGASATVAPLGERTSNRRRVTGVAKLHPPQLSVRRRWLGHEQRRASGLAEHGSTAREAQKRVLTPFVFGDPMTRTLILYLCVAGSVSAAEVEDRIDWPAFLARHDLVWESVPRSGTKGPSSATGCWGR